MALYDEPGEPARPEPFSRFTLERIQKAVNLLPLESGADNFLITCHIAEVLPESIQVCDCCSCFAHLTKATLASDGSIQAEYNHEFNQRRSCKLATPVGDPLLVNWCLVNLESHGAPNSCKTTYHREYVVSPDLMQHLHYLAAGPPVGMPGVRLNRAQLEYAEGFRKKLSKSQGTPYISTRTLFNVRRIGQLGDAAGLGFNFIQERSLDKLRQGIYGYWEEAGVRREIRVVRIVHGVPDNTISWGGTYNAAFAPSDWSDPSKQT